MMRKKDEMEMSVSNRATRIAWFVTVMVLFIIGGILFFMNNQEMNIFLMLATFSVTMQFSIEQYLLAKVNEDNRFKKYIAMALIGVVVLLTIAWISG